MKNVSTKRFLALSVSVILHAAGIYYLGSLALDYALPEGQVETVEMSYDVNEGSQVETTQVDVVETPAPVEKPAPIKAVEAPKPSAPPVAKSLPVKEESLPAETPTQEESPVPVPVVEVPAPSEPIAAAPNEELQNDLLKDDAQSDVPATDPVATAESNTLPEESERIMPDQTTTQPYGRPEGVQSDKVLTPIAGNKSINYPTMARLRKIEGTAIVHYTVSGEGFVTDVKVAQSSGSSLLDNEAVSAIKSWKFKPTGQEGVYERPIRFKLSGDPKEAPSQLRRLNK